MTKPAPGPDQPPIPVRLVTFNTHHGVGEDERHDLPRLATGAGRGGRRRDLPAGGRPALRGPQRGRRPGAAALPRAGHAAGLGAGDRRAAPGRRAGRRQYGNALLSRLPILISDVHRLPGGGRAAQRAAHHARTRRRHAVGDQHAPEHRRGRTAGRAGGRPRRRCTPSSMEAGVAGRRLQRRAPTPRSWPRCAGGSPTRGSWPTTGTTRPAGGSGSTTRGARTPRTPRTGGSTRCGSPRASPSPRRRSWTREGASDHLPLMVDLEVRAGSDGTPGLSAAG